MDRDGTNDGYDIPLTRAVARSVSIPVIASGGAGKLEDFAEVVVEADADAVLAASTLHYGLMRVRDIKRAMADAGVPVRHVDVPDTPVRPMPLTWKE
jgi:cyclase